MRIGAWARDNRAGWIYNILPYLEQQALYLLPADGDPKHVTTKQTAGAATMSQQPLAMMICPTRRQPMLYPYPLDSKWRPKNVDDTPTVARADYAANTGDSQVCSSDGPPSLDEGDTTSYNWNTGAQYDKSTGVIYQRSEIRMAGIRDGTSNTYLVGEKYLDPDNYLNGEDSADNSAMFQGQDVDCEPLDRSRAYAKARPIRCNSVLELRQRPHQRLQFCFLRRLGPFHQLLDRCRNPPLLGQPSGRLSDRFE